MSECEDCGDDAIGRRMKCKHCDQMVCGYCVAETFCRACADLAIQAAVEAEREATVRYVRDHWDDSLAVELLGIRADPSSHHCILCSDESNAAIRARAKKAEAGT